MKNTNSSNDLQKIITQALEEMKCEKGKLFDIAKVNLADLERRTNISRGKLRRIKDNGFIVMEHGRTGMKAQVNILSGYTGILDVLLSHGVSNSSVCYDRIVEFGYKGSKTSVKRYLKNNRHLIPAKRQLVAPQGSRGQRYSSEPGMSYQMDWGFVNVETGMGATYKAACFAMICHHCGKRYIEFFPNAKQENLFIGMIHAFRAMGIPDHVLTDNMKSVVNRRDQYGNPIWNNAYEVFMKDIGFETRLCKPAHPFTKGAVERLVRFVKDNFLAARVCSNITELNYQAVRWCNEQDNRYHQAVDCIPDAEHSSKCLAVTKTLELNDTVMRYLSPERRISFDGFVNYEGRRFGVPYWYTKKTCRVRRDAFTIYIYSDDMLKTLVEHDVTWSRKDSFCKDQYTSEQPEEFPTAPVRTTMTMTEGPDAVSPFDKFAFGRRH